MKIQIYTQEEAMISQYHGGDCFPCQTETLYKHKLLKPCLLGHSVGRVAKTLKGDTFQAFGFRAEGSTSWVSRPQIRKAEKLKF